MIAPLLSASTSLQRREARIFLLALLVSFNAPGMASEARPGEDKPTLLPRVNVSAEVPLVKIDDFQLIEKRYGAAAVNHGDFIYIIGGARGDLVIDSVERFNVRTGKSEPFARLKQGRTGHRAVVIGDRIYVLGGYTRIDQLTGPTPSVEIIDLTTGKLSAGTPMPKGRALFGCVALNRKIYVIGGHTLKRNLVEWSVEADQWEATQVTKQSRIFAFTNTVAIFDPVSQHWTDGTPMPAPCETVGVTVADTSIVVVGGFEGGKVVDEADGSPFLPNETYAASDQVVAFNPRDQTWRIQPALHRRVRDHSLAFLGHSLFVFGAKDAEDELIAYDLTNRHSESFTLGYKRAHETAAVVYEDKIYVIGGKDSSDVAVDYIQVFKLQRPAPPASPASAGRSATAG